MFRKWEDTGVSTNLFQLLRAPNACSCETHQNETNGSLNPITIVSVRGHATTENICLEKIFCKAKISRRERLKCTKSWLFSDEQHASDNWLMRSLSKWVILFYGVKQKGNMWVKYTLKHALKFFVVDVKLKNLSCLDFLIERMQTNPLRFLVWRHTNQLSMFYFTVSCLLFVCKRLCFSLFHSSMLMSNTLLTLVCKHAYEKGIVYSCLWAFCELELI